MDKSQWEARKVVIIGAGAVGSTFAYTLAQSGIVDEIALIDVNQELVKGQVLDLVHGRPFFPSVKIYSGNKEDYSNAQVIVVTAGARQRSGESRLDLLQRNVTIIESIVEDITEQRSNGVIVVVSNPVDVLTYVAHKKSGWSGGRVIGSGTMLDSARFRSLLAEHCGVDIHNIHAYFLGEHGDSEFAAWSMTHIAGMPIDNYCPICMRCDDWDRERKEIVEKVRNSAYHIIDYKGATYYAIGMALVRIVEAIVRNQKSILTVSTIINGEYGLSDVCLSVPSVVSESGVEKIVVANLPTEEQEALAQSAAIVKNVIAELKM